MLLRQLSLANFRNYARLDLPLEPGLSVFWGDNGQGKSNLLEAVYMLATTRSFRTSNERDLISWFADAEPLFARVAGDVGRGGAATRLELIVAQTPPADSVRRRARVNGHDRPLGDLLGHLNVVLFSPEDVELVSGPAERRRRYLDITLCQVDPRYLRALRRYLRVLTQRNALLRLARDRRVPPDEFDYWDSQLVQLGAELLVTRLEAVAFLDRQLEDVYPRLTDEAGRLSLEYRGTIPLDGLALPADDTPAARAAVEAEVARRFGQQLAALATRERAQAVTLSGIHRDDAAFLVDGVDLRTYGSRGQQRLAALALKLVETVFMQARSGDRPVLLLDDVMSELDPRRRAFLQDAIRGRGLPGGIGAERPHDGAAGGVEWQVFLTATDLVFFDPGFLGAARRYRVTHGEVTKDL